MIEEGNDFDEFKLRVNWLNVCYFAFTHRINDMSQRHTATLIICVELLCELRSSNLHATTHTHLEAVYFGVDFFFAWNKLTQRMEMWFNVFVSLRFVLLLPVTAEGERETKRKKRSIIK